MTLTIDSGTVMIGGTERTREIVTVTRITETICNIVEIGGFSFDWILFTDLEGFFKERNNYEYFDLVRDRYGVYFFFDGSLRVEYVGCIMERPLKERVKQYLQRSLDTQGNQFAGAWLRENHPDELPNDAYLTHYKGYVETLKLGTLSLIRDMCALDLDDVIEKSNDMEKYLIRKLHPLYNTNHHEDYITEMTQHEQHELCSSLLVDVQGERIRLQDCLVSNTDG